MILTDKLPTGIDHETEILVREIVARDVNGKTVIAVLYWLEHILDFDLAVVLDQGKVVEARYLEGLLQNESRVLKDL